MVIFMGELLVSGRVTHDRAGFNQNLYLGCLITVIHHQTRDEINTLSPFNVATKDDLTPKNSMQTWGLTFMLSSYWHFTPES